jgi:hypothetical protein
MNAIPLINNAPRPNINVGSIGSPAFNPVAAGAKLGGSIGGNVMRQTPASMPVNNETQLRQEVNTSIVALKREAFSLENLITQAAQTLQDINKRLSELEGKQGDYVKKADATVDSVGGDGKYISAISETDGKINATATDLGNMVPVNSVTSGNMHSVTSNAVKVRFRGMRFIFSQRSGVGVKTYLKITGIISVYERTAVYMMTSRAGELVILSIGSNDSNVCIPYIKRLFRVYAKIEGFSYNGTDLFVKLDWWANLIELTQIAGRSESNISITSATEADYNAGTQITIEEG